MKQVRCFDPERPLEELASSVLIRLLNDLRAIPAEKRSESLDWHYLHSDRVDVGSFVEFCQVLSFDPAYIRQGMLDHLAGLDSVMGMALPTVSFACIASDRDGDHPAPFHRAVLHDTLVTLCDWCWRAMEAEGELVVCVDGSPLGRIVWGGPA